MQRDVIHKEIHYKAVRSSGAGGQHVNKVSSKVILSFNVIDSKGLSDEEKRLILQNLGAKLTNQGLLILSADESRSQFRNKAIVTSRLMDVLQEATIKPTARKQTKPSRASKIRNSKNKQHQSQKKNLRKKPSADD